MRECPECGGRWPDGTVTCPDDGGLLVAEGTDPYIGRPVGSYVISRMLGRGGMGAVYEAQHPSIGSKVAVKFLHRRYASDPAIVDRFFNEARAVNVIGHDNIVHVSDFSRMEDGSPYFIMEFLEGQPLTGLVGAPRSLEEMGPIFLQVAEGLHAAHEKGIIHRDLKPDNIFLVQRGRRANFVKIVDFGIAKLQSPEGPGAASRTRTGMVMGTAQYMSPEQAGGEVNRISPASDVYALGVIMFQLATGRLPFEGESFGEILVGHLVHPPPEPRSIEPSVPEGYEQVILKCLAKKPEDRYQNMEALFDALGAELDAHALSRDLPLAKPRTRSDPGSFRPPLVTPPMSAPGTARTPPQTRPTKDGEAGHTMMLGDEKGEAPTAMIQPGAYVPRRKSSTPLIAGIAGAIVVVAVGIMLLKKPEAPPPAPPAPPPVVVEKKTPEPTTIEIGIESAPPGAKLTITQAGKTFNAVTPTTLKLDKGKEVVATLAAAGFEALEERFIPEEPRSLKYVLVAAKEEPKPEPKVEPRPVVRADPKPAVKPPPKPKSQAVGDGLVDVEF